jgi:hypothetical protein
MFTLIGLAGTLWSARALLAPSKAEAWLQQSKKPNGHSVDVRCRLLNAGYQTFFGDFWFIRNPISLSLDG